MSEVLLPSTGAKGTAAGGIETRSILGFGIVVRADEYNRAFSELERLRAKLDSVLSFDAGKGVTIEAAPQQDGSKEWKICHMRNVMGRDGEWEWEPSPSNRDDEFMARCRFETAEEAFSVLARFR